MNTFINGFSNLLASYLNIIYLNIIRPYSYHHYWTHTGLVSPLHRPVCQYSARPVYSASWMNPDIKRALISGFSIGMLFYASFNQSHAAVAEAYTAPQTTVYKFQQSLLKTIQKASPEDYDDRLASLQKTLTSYLDPPFVARLALGNKTYGQLAKDQQQAYETLFQRFLAATLIHRFFGGEQALFSIYGERDGPNQTRIVEAGYSPTSGSETRVSYLLRQRGGKWRIIDVVLAGSVSEITLKRAEFNAVIKNKGTSGLFSDLSQKIAELRSLALRR